MTAHASRAAAGALAMQRFLDTDLERLLDERAAADKHRYSRPPPMR
jgi:hypothetical protein